MCPPVRPDYDRFFGHLDEPGLWESDVDADPDTGTNEDSEETAEDGLMNLVDSFFQGQPIDMMYMIREILQFADANNSLLMHRSLIVDYYNRTCNDEEVRDNMSDHADAFFQQLETAPCTESQYLRERLRDFLQELPAEYQVPEMALWVAAKLCHPGLTRQLMLRTAVLNHRRFEQ